ncbi:hypothetical protein D3C76_1052630 [compost metagenome]
MVLELFVVQLVDGAEDFEVCWWFHADVLENGITYLNQVGDSLFDYKSSAYWNGGLKNPTGVGSKVLVLESHLSAPTGSLSRFSSTRLGVPR